MNLTEAITASRAVTDYLLTLQGGGTPPVTPPVTPPGTPPVTPPVTPPASGRPRFSPDGKYALTYVDGFRFDGSRLVVESFDFAHTVVIPFVAPSGASSQIKVFEYGELSSWRKATISKVPGDMRNALVAGQAAGGPTLNFNLGATEVAGGGFAPARLIPGGAYFLNIRNETMAGGPSLTTGCAVSS